MVHREYVTVRHAALARYVTVIAFLLYIVLVSSFSCCLSCMKLLVNFRTFFRRAKYSILVVQMFGQPSCDVIGQVILVLCVLFGSLCCCCSRLLDGDVGAGGPEGSFNVFKQRKFKLQSLQRICQRYPVVPQCE